MIINPALFVVYVQNDFCADEGALAKAGNDVKDIQKAVGSLMEFINYAKRLKIPIVYIKSYYDSKFLCSNIRESYVAKGLYGICNSSAWGSCFYRLKPKKNIFIKHRYDAFTNSQLDEWLKKKKIKTILFSGCQTDVCVHATAISAFMKGYRIACVKDSLASTNESEHNRSLRFLKKYCNSEMI